MQTWKIKKKTQRKQTSAWRPRIIAILLLLATVVAFGYDFPQYGHQWGLTESSENPYRLGLDLQGGTHLVYEADMNQIEDADRLEALEGVRDVIERRVNAFGVSEPVVQTTATGDTYRVIVELAGVLDVSDAISQIGETPVLEFKEPGEELDREPTQEELNELETRQAEDKKLADTVLARARAGESFDALVEEFSIDRTKDDSKGLLEGLTTSSFYSEFVFDIEKNGLQPGQVYWNTLVNDDGVNVYKLSEKTTKPESLLSHILICFEGKTQCANPIPAIEASIQINKLKEQTTAENFAQLAIDHSTGPSAPGGGDLGWSDTSSFVPAFKLAADSLAVGDISDSVETQYGYHLIHKRDVRDTPAYTVQRIVLPFTEIQDIVPDSSPWKNTDLSGKHLDRSTVQFDHQTGAAYVALDFNSEGGDLFGELTEAHVGEPIAIFLDGTPISVPTVQQAIYGGQAVITGDFSVEEAKLLAQRLNAGALPVPVELLSQQTVGPTLGSISLEKSIKAALYGFALVALYMLLVYRLPGLIAVIALFLFAFLNLAAYRMFGVTVTLAGIAGFVLSLGIAVDANVLIIERLKEEYASGRDFVSSLDEAFKRAWTAIRDGNITTLIAAAVLYWFSSSFIRGFALTLSIGVILSMFTAITVTRVYLKSVLGWKAIRKPGLFGFKRQ